MTSLDLLNAVLLSVSTFLEHVNSRREYAKSAVSLFNLLPVFKQYVTELTHGYVRYVDKSLRYLDVTYTIM